MFVNMEFKDLKIGDNIYILESVGTFNKVNNYNIGTITLIGQPYDDTSLDNPYISNMFKKKKVDITISCEGVSKKITVDADKDVITDNTLGLTISTSKQQLVSQIQTWYKDCQSKLAAMQRYKEEATKYQQMLQQLKGETENQNNNTTTDIIKVG